MTDWDRCPYCESDDLHSALGDDGAEVVQCMDCEKIHPESAAQLAHRNLFLKLEDG